MSNLLIPSFLVSNVSESLMLLTKNERCERIPIVAQKWVTMRKSLSSLTKKVRDHEQIAEGAHQKWANEPIAGFFERIPHSLYRRFILVL